MTDHELNQRLAAFVGKDVFECIFGVEYSTHIGWGHADEKGKIQEWDPLHNPVQMERVEEELVKQGYDWGVQYTWRDQHYSAEIYLDPNPSGDPKVLYKTGMADSKLKALALAVVAMLEAHK